MCGHHNINVTVYLERISYTLDVDIDGNIESTEYYYGSIVAQPEYPEKVGFYFDSWVDENGYTHLVMADTYDFNKESGGLVQAGYNAMKEGKIDPFYTMHEIVIKI